MARPHQDGRSEEGDRLNQSDTGPGRRPGGRSRTEKIVGDDQEAVAVGRGIQAVLEGFEAATLDRRGLALGLLDDLVCGVRRERAFLVGLRCLTSDERVFDELSLGLILCDLRLAVGRA